MYLKKTLKILAESTILWNNKNKKIYKLKNNLQTLKNI